jgi:hypothetical protein
MKNFATYACILAVMFMLVGCSGSDNPKTYETTITVTLDGVPVPEAQITLHSTDPENTNSSYGETDDKGVCRITTFEDADGAVPGNYQVAFRCIETITEPNPSEYDPEGVKVIAENEIIPSIYNVPSDKHVIDVTEDGPNEWTFDLSKNP